MRNKSISLINHNVPLLLYVPPPFQYYIDLHDYMFSSHVFIYVLLGFEMIYVTNKSYALYIRVTYSILILIY